MAASAAAGASASEESDPKNDQRLPHSLSHSAAKPGTVVRGGGKGRVRALDDQLERRVLEHEPPLGAVVGETHGHDAVRLDPRDDALAERRVADGVAGRELGMSAPPRGVTVGEP